jgi:hypothetical protein
MQPAGAADLEHAAPGRSRLDTSASRSSLDAGSELSRSAGAQAAKGPHSPTRRRPPHRLATTLPLPVPCCSHGGSTGSEEEEQLMQRARMDRQGGLASSPRQQPSPAAPASGLQLGTAMVCTPRNRPTSTPLATPSN